MAGARGTCQFVVDNILSVVSKRFGKEANYFNKLKKDWLESLGEKKNSVYFPTLRVDFRPFSYFWTDALCLPCVALGPSMPHLSPTPTLRSPLPQAPAEASQGLSRGSQAGSRWYLGALASLICTVYTVVRKLLKKYKLKKIPLFLHRLSLPVSFLDSWTKTGSFSCISVNCIILL